MALPNKSRLLDTEEAAEFIDVSPSTLVTWRSRKSCQIPYVKIGSNVRYDLADLVAWLESRKVHAGALQGAR